LKGLAGQDPLHWRGDRTNFLFFNGAFQSLLGGSMLSAADMQTFRAFINTLVFEPNPNQNLDRSFPTAFPTKNGMGDAANGNNIFANEVFLEYRTCATCHEPPAGSSLVIFPGGSTRGPQDLKVPHLRNVYQKLNLTRDAGQQSVGGFGIAHDGSHADIFKFLTQPLFEEFSTNATIKRDLDAFVQCFDTGMAPAVGFARTLHAADVDSAGISGDWTLLEDQAAATNIDLIVKGMVDGRPRGFIYEPASDAYKADTTDVPAMTRAQLRAKVLAGDTLTIMGVPPGSGTRLGIDRNLDGVRDGDVPSPALRIARNADNVVVSWPTEAGDYLLERANALPAIEWALDRSPRGINDNEFTVTNSPSVSNVYFRLRKL
jgi:hypothetical protein